MARPSKKHDGQTIEITAGENCLDAGAKITGVYRHIPRRSTFGFTPKRNVAHLGSNHECIFSRDEWVVTSTTCLDN